jgi:hypothetical protein
MENNRGIRPDTAQELIKSICLLAINGRGSFRKYLFDPLYEAGWYNDSKEKSTRRFLEQLRREYSDPSYLHTIAPRCRRLVCYSMAESMSALGNSSIFFLEIMQTDPGVADTLESAEFTGISTGPLESFTALSSEKSERLFQKGVNSAGESEIVEAFETVRLESWSEKVRLDAEIRRLYDNIQIASSYHNIPRCRKLLASYIISYGDSPDYARDEVEKLVQAMDRREPGFGSDLRNTIAIDLHYRITRSIQTGDISSTIRHIRKYGYIFEGDSSSRHFYDVDRLERILYEIISERGLWKNLKKETRSAK